MKRFVSLVGCCLALALTHTTQAQTECGGAVTVGGSTISVASEAGNDTANLQCALDVAIENSISSIQLSGSAYSIDSVSAVGFRGSISGVSKANTVVTLNAAGVACAENDPSALRFYVGAPAIERMTINAEELCGSTGGKASAIGFYSNANSCSDDRTVFGNVDRVVINGPGASATDLVSAVSMTKANACDDIVLGTLKVNRSEISGLSHGVLTSIGGEGQVDINFNTFTNMGTSIAIANANQGSSIASNTINFNDTENFASVAGFGVTGILVGGDANAPSLNLTSIKKNTFKNGNAGAAGYAVLVGQEGNKVAHSMWVSSNRFEGVEVTTTRAPHRNNTASASAALPQDPLSYQSDFESFTSLEGWSAYINVFDEDCSSFRYGYPYEIGAGDPVQVAVRADGSDGKALNVFSDYNNVEGATACIEANVFREVTLTSGMIGDYRWSYNVEEPEAVGSKTFAQFRLIDPSNDYALAAESVVPTAGSEEVQSVEISLDDSQIGMLFQYGFSTKSVNQENSGMLYDNVVLEAIGDAGGGGGGGGGGGSEPAGGGTGYGVAIIDTDGSIVSGNRFVAGANAWVAANGASLGPVSGMSIVDNTFAGSTAGTDIALGADTANGVVGSGQNSPTYSDDGSNDVLQGSPLNTDTGAMTTEISAQFALEWGLITGQ
ncbi:MAG: hypothetical protein ISP97_05375 [Luminiphilus sp.]|nr:hypothetical protein [Luminiphilus sp.]